MSTLILVTGQHRSGTSATAGCLGHLGVALGRHLMPANAANPKGYFEDVRVVEEHDKLLMCLSAAWDRPWDVPERYLEHPTTRAVSNALKGIISSFGADLFAIKDPRASLFMRMWCDITQDLGVRLVVLQPLRKPEAVATSLLVREGWDPARADRVVRCYDAAIQSWPPDLTSTAIGFPHELWQASRWECVGAELDVELDITQIGKVHTFLDGGLVHHG